MELLKQIRNQNAKSLSFITAVFGDNYFDIVDIPTKPVGKGKFKGVFLSEDNRQKNGADEGLNKLLKSKSVKDYCALHELKPSSQWKGGEMILNQDLLKFLSEVGVNYPCREIFSVATGTPAPNINFKELTKAKFGAVKNLLIKLCSIFV